MRIAKKLMCLMLVLALSLSFFACSGTRKSTLNVLTGATISTRPAPAV